MALSAATPQTISICPMTNRLRPPATGEEDERREAAFEAVGF
jgi:hypothetical protein